MKLDEITGEWGLGANVRGKVQNGGNWEKRKNQQGQPGLGGGQQGRRATKGHRCGRSWGWGSLSGSCMQAVVNLSGADMAAEGLQERLGKTGAGRITGLRMQ